jgi:hypothetical protein
MTAPPLSPYLSPMAGLFNAVVAYLNGRLADRVTELKCLIAAEVEYGHELRTHRDFAETKAAGYIDTGLEP